MILTQLYNEFFKSEKTGGFILISCTIISILLANSIWNIDYFQIWQYSIGGHSIVHWINDGLMTIFFLLIGLELERELYKGELSNLKNASLPILGAMGGMLVPAFIYLIFNIGTKYQSGFGIPMATDIAFAIGFLSLLGKKVPSSLKIFLTAFAVIDDLGAIIIIAIFYTSTLSFLYLFLALLVFLILIILNRFKVYNLIPYIIGGIVMWYFMLNSGVHATITGVLLAFAIPFKNGDHKSPSNILQHILHKPVAFIILPLFAMANTCISIIDNWHIGLIESSSLGIILGLVLGKPFGIWLFSYIGVLLGFCIIPSDLKWKHIIGAGILGGIGFTMSIFITLLAFKDSSVINNSKIAILFASIISGIIGYLFLNVTLNKRNKLQNS